MLLCLGEPPVSFSVVRCWLQLFIHFSIIISFLIFICRCSSFTFVFDIIRHPSVDYRRVFIPILYFRPSPSQSDSRNFHFQLFRYLLISSATVLSGHFLLTGVFYLTVLHRHFDCVFQVFPGSRQFFLEVCRSSY